MEKYCLGFLFDIEGKKVVLIQKQKPDWQRNKINGVGGKIEEGESALEAMCREFEEETGLFIENWSHFCTLKFKENTIVECFFALSLHFYKAKTQFQDGKLTEQICVFDVNNLPHSCIPNLHWLIPQALSLTCGETKQHFTVQ